LTAGRKGEEGGHIKSSLIARKIYLGNLLSSMLKALPGLRFMAGVLANEALRK
jgi:hypothetical protein